MTAMSVQLQSYNLSFRTYVAATYFLWVTSIVFHWATIVDHVCYKVPLSRWDFFVFLRARPHGMAITRRESLTISGSTATFVSRLFVALRVSALQLFAEVGKK